MATFKKSGWVCRGYGTPHGYRKGRMWFACGACSWYHTPTNPVLLEVKENDHG